jgi:hypothetical protein
VLRTEKSDFESRDFELCKFFYEGLSISVFLVKYWCSHVIQILIFEETGEQSYKLQQRKFNTTKTQMQAHKQQFTLHKP